MDSSNWFDESKNRLKTVNELFSKLVAITNSINVLHSSELKKLHVPPDNDCFNDQSDVNTLSPLALGAYFEENLCATKVVTSVIENDRHSITELGATKNQSDVHTLASGIEVGAFLKEDLQGKNVTASDGRSFTDFGTAKNQSDVNTLSPLGAYFEDLCDTSVIENERHYIAELGGTKNQSNVNTLASGIDVDKYFEEDLPGAEVVSASIAFGACSNPCLTSNHSSFPSYADMNRPETGSTENHSGLGGESNDCVTVEDGQTDQSDKQRKLTNVEPCHINVKTMRGCDKLKMFVPTSDQGKKQLCCIYCLERFTKLARHLTTVHKDEEDVKPILELEPNSKERLFRLGRLRKLGQFEWNMNGDINGGELATTRRPNPKFKREAFPFETCANCLGSYSPTVIRHHFNKCTNKQYAGEQISKVKSQQVEARVHVDACEALVDQVFPSMRRNKEAAAAIRFDWIVIVYGNDLCFNFSPHYQLAMVRQQLRDAGRLLITARTDCKEITDFASLYHVKHCNVVIAAIRTLARYDPTLNKFNSPGTAATLFTLVNKIGEYLVIEYIKFDDEEKERIVSRFLKVFEKDAKTKINKMVRVDKLQMHRDKAEGESLPSTDDVQRLAIYLDNERDTCFKELSEQFSHEKWLRIVELTSMSILVFNRKRVGDIQNILVRDFHNRENVAEHRAKLQIAVTEGTEEIKSRMQLRGKLYRTVSILLNDSFEKCLELMLRYRKEAGVPDGNKFLFGLPSKIGITKTINACVLFRKHSDLCGAETPSSLRGTKLRKHFATLCGTMGLNFAGVTNVAKFMGHSVKVNQDVYRQSQLQQEVVQITPLLNIAQGKINDTITKRKRNVARETGPKPKKRRVLAPKKSKKN